MPGKNYKRQWAQRAQDRLKLGIMKQNCSEGEWCSTEARIQTGPVSYLLADFQIQLAQLGANRPDFEDFSEEKQTTTQLHAVSLLSRCLSKTLIFMCTSALCASEEFSLNQKTVSMF